MWVPDIRLHGVGLNVILDGVCVVELDAASPFDKHTRGLLQTAADSDQSADTLYHHCKDADLKQECWNIGFGEEDYCAGCLVRSKVRGVGTIIERALMLALVMFLGSKGRCKGRDQQEWYCSESTTHTRRLVRRPFALRTKVPPFALRAEMSQMLLSKRPRAVP